MVDVPVLGTGVARRVGSSPTKGKIKIKLGLKYKKNLKYKENPV